MWGCSGSPILNNKLFGLVPTRISGVSTNLMAAAWQPDATAHDEWDPAKVRASWVFDPSSPLPRRQRSEGAELITGAAIAKNFSSHNSIRVNFCLRQRSELRARIDSPSLKIQPGVLDVIGITEKAHTSRSQSNHSAPVSREACDGNHGRFRASLFCDFCRSTPEICSFGSSPPFSLPLITLRRRERPTFLHRHHSVPRHGPQPHSLERLSRPAANLKSEMLSDLGTNYFSPLPVFFSWVTSNPALGSILVGQACQAGQARLVRDAPARREVAFCGGSPTPALACIFPPGILQRRVQPYHPSRLSGGLPQWGSREDRSARPQSTVQ